MAKAYRTKDGNEHTSFFEKNWVGFNLELFNLNGQPYAILGSFHPNIIKIRQEEDRIFIDEKPIQNLRCVYDHRGFNRNKVYTEHCIVAVKYDVAERRYEEFDNPRLYISAPIENIIEK